MRTTLRAAAWAVIATMTTSLLLACGKAGDTQHAGSGQPAAQAAAEDTSPVVARYGGQTFTQQDLQQELGRLNRRSREALQDKDRLHQFVENLVLSRLIYREGEKLGHDKDPEVERQVSDLRRRLVIQKVMQEHQSSPVTDEEVRAYYDAHPEEFTTDRVKASHILVKDEADAKAIKAELDADPSKFEELAKTKSTDRSNSSKGGDLGFFGRGRMVKEFEDAAFALEENGQISDIVQTRFGYHIIKRTDREDGSPKSFDDVKSQIRIRLINDKRRAQTEQFLDKLKKDAQFSLDDAALASVEIVAPAEEGETSDAERSEMLPPGH